MAMIISSGCYGTPTVLNATLLWMVNAPRVKCRKDRIAMLPIPWSGRGSGFSKTMETRIIALLEETDIKAAVRLPNLGWSEIDGVMA